MYNSILDKIWIENRKHSYYFDSYHFTIFHNRYSSFWESTLTFSPLPSWTTFPFLLIPFLPSFPLFLLHSYSIKHAKELNRSTVLFRRDHRHECLRSFYTNILMNAAPLMRGTAYYSSHNAFPLLTPISLRLPRLFFHFSRKI